MSLFDHYGIFYSLNKEIDLYLKPQMFGYCLSLSPVLYKTYVIFHVAILQEEVLIYLSFHGENSSIFRTPHFLDPCESSNARFF